MSHITSGENFSREATKKKTAFFFFWLTGLITQDPTKMLKQHFGMWNATSHTPSWCETTHDFFAKQDLKHAPHQNELRRRL